MASKTVEQSARSPHKGPKGREYQPADRILSVPGVKRVELRTWCDAYSGSMVDLVSAGLATEDMFPGQPGRPVSSVAYRPGGRVRAGERRDRESWIYVPGYLTLYRCPSGQFRAVLTVSREVRQQRQQAEERAREQRDAQERAEDARLAQSRQQMQRADRLRSLPATPSEFRRRIAHKFQILIEQGLLPQMRAESGFRFSEAFVEDLMADMKASYFAILEADIEGVSPRVEQARKDKGLQQFLAECVDSAAPGDGA